MVEKNGGCGINTDGLDTIAVEVEDERVASDWTGTGKSLGVAVFAAGQGVDAGAWTGAGAGTGT